MENSDDEDMFHVRAMSSTSLPNEYQKCFLYRWLCAVHELTAHLRDNVLLPLDPRAENQNTVFTEVDSGIALPLWHCPFQTCGADGQQVFCKFIANTISSQRKGSHEKAFWTHIRVHHLTVLRNITKKLSLDEKQMKEAEVHLTLLNAALAEKERSSVPLLGHSTDRRSIEHVREVFREDNVHVLMCFMCACKEVMHIGYDKFGEDVRSRNG